MICEEIASEYLPNPITVLIHLAETAFLPFLQFLHFFQNSRKGLLKYVSLDSTDFQTSLSDIGSKLSIFFPLLLGASGKRLGL
jgi:hypothetical protein